MIQRSLDGLFRPAAVLAFHGERFCISSWFVKGAFKRREAVLTLDKPAGNASVSSWNARTDLTLFVRQMPKFLPVGKLLRIANDELIPLCPSPL